MFYDCIQFLLLQQLKLNEFKDTNGELLKMFQKILHMFPGNCAIFFKVNKDFKIINNILCLDNLSSWNSFSQFLHLYQKEKRDFKKVSADIEEVLKSAQ